MNSSLLNDTIKKNSLLGVLFQLTCYLKLILVKLTSLVQIDIFSLSFNTHYQVTHRPQFLHELATFV